MCRKLSAGYVLVAGGSNAPSSSTAAKKGKKRKANEGSNEGEGEEDEEEEGPPRKKANFSFLGAPATALTLSMQNAGDEEEDGEGDGDEGVYAGGYYDPSKVREEPLQKADGSRPSLSSCATALFESYSPFLCLSFPQIFPEFGSALIGIS